MVTVELPGDVEALAHCAGWDRAQIEALEPAWASIAPAAAWDDDDARRLDAAARAVRSEQVGAVWASVSGPARDRLLERFTEGTSRPHAWSSSAGAVGTGFAERALAAWSGTNPAARGHIAIDEPTPTPRSTAPGGEQR